MAAKKILYDQEAREAVRRGVKKLAEAVKVIESIRTSVEKAKGIVAHFKHLTVAQQIIPIPSASHAGRISLSMSRATMLYRYWPETNLLVFIRSAAAFARTICHP